MRATWAFAVICLLAVTAAQPARAAELDAHRAHPQLIERHPVLPAVVAARHSSLIVAVRAATPAPQLPLAVVVTPPTVALRVPHAFAIAPHRAHAPGSASVPTRSARGPPGC